MAGNAIGGRVVEMRPRRAATDLGQLVQGRMAAARISACLDHEDFAEALTEHVGWQVTHVHAAAWETTAVPPADVLIAAEMIAGPGSHTRMRLVVDYDELQAELTAVVDAARDTLAITGSRSRDPDYLAQIEEAVTGHGLTHYRVLYGPPRHMALKNHLLHLADTPGVRIGIARDLYRDQERFMCVSEATAVIVLPSISSIANFDTAVTIHDPDVAGAWVRHIRQAYYGAEPLDRDDIKALEIVR